jgi:hypothetical protein
MLKYLETNSSRINTEIFIEKFSNNKILVIGSGPSLNLVNWKTIEFDSIVTTTFFYLNDEIRNLKNISHITLSEIVDFEDNRLLEFLENNPDCTIALEPKIGRPFYSSDVFKKFELENRDRLIYYNTEIDDKEGAAGRLCFFVMSFNPSEIYYVGIDGRSKNIENDPLNSFRTNIRDGDNGRHGYDTIYQSHMQMAKSLHEYSKYNNCKLFNLGEGFDFNCSTDYSKKHFPLSSEIKNILKL